MKTILNILLITAALCFTQACETKKEENKEAVVDAKTADGTKTLTAEERRAKIQKERTEREESRRLAWEEKAKLNPTYTDANGNVIYYKAEVNPAFAGGQEALEKYIQENVTYPESAQGRQDEGTVFVDFVIAKDGTVQEAEVTDATSDVVDDSFRSEALRVIRGMPAWTPAKQGGKTVAVKMNIPITFELI